MAVIKSTDSTYTAIRLSCNLHSEKLVASVVAAFQEDYLNSFSPFLDLQQSCNFSSGVAVEDSNRTL